MVIINNEHIDCLCDKCVADQYKGIDDISSGISMDKEYKTRDGRAVTIYSNAVPGDKPIHGHIHGSDEPDSWYRNGFWWCKETPDDEDLIEVSRLPKIAKNVPVLVKICGSWVVRHYCKKTVSGRHVYYIDGKTSYTAEDGGSLAVEEDCIRIPTTEELNHGPKQDLS